MTPRVTVLIGAFNNATTVGKAIDSILGQTVEELELLVLERRIDGELGPLLRDRARGSSEPGTLPPLAERRWFLSPNNTVVGAVRLNLAGREPAGRISPADRPAVLRWLSQRLVELVNVDTGVLTFIDTGMVGELGLRQRLNLVGLLYTSTKSDPRALAQSLRALSQPFRETDPKAFDENFSQHVGPLMDVPVRLMAAMQTQAIRPTSSPYSTSEAPSSSQMNLAAAV